jgi:hypothetical protein
MSDGRFAGVDWASEEHAVCVVDERGRPLKLCPHDCRRAFASEHLNAVQGLDEPQRSHRRPDRRRRDRRAADHRGLITLL